MMADFPSQARRQPPCPARPIRARNPEERRLVEAAGRSRAWLVRVRRPGPAHTLVEVVVSALIVSVMLVAALQALASARVHERNTGNRARAVQFAQSLLTEIMRQAYVEPTETPVFGPEASEPGRSRAAFDDVDDYHNWTASPPQYKDGTAVPDGTGWTEEVHVAYEWSTAFLPPPPGAVPTGTLISDLEALGKSLLQAGSTTDTGIKLITVTIRRDGDIIAQLRAVRTIDLAPPGQPQPTPDLIWNQLGP